MFTVLCALILLFALLYKYSTRNFDYWKSRGVLQPKPFPFVGNIIEVLTFRLTVGHYLGKVYDKFKTPYFGVYVLNKPCLVVRDPKLMKAVLVTDFNYFCDRNLLSDEACDPVMASAVGFLKGSEWACLRGKITPIFSLAKVKGMMNLFIEATDEMLDFISSNLDEDYLEAKDVMFKYTIDVVSACVFGLKAHSFANNEHSEFSKITKIMFDFNWKNGFSQSCYFMAPDLIKLLKLPFFDPRVNDFMRRVFWAVLEERKKIDVKRNDLIDVMIQLTNENKPDDEYIFEGDRVVALPLTFFAAGIEAPTNTLSFILYELCLNEEIQDTLQEEIREVLAECKEISYEAIQKMKYMDMVIYETLRKYPPLPFIDRTCVKDYRIPNTDVVIEKGTPIFIPMLGVHMDPEIYPNPEKFDPERFSDRGDDSLFYLPFGIGPRSCIGIKFAVILMKIALTRILSEFKVERCPATPVPIQFETKSFLVASKHGMPMKFNKHVK